jgi:hypothetical protein
MSFINQYFFLLVLSSLNLIQISKVAAFEVSDQTQMADFSVNREAPKRGLFGQVIFYDRRPKMTQKQIKKLYEMVEEQMKKERELMFEQERKEKIYRELLAQPSSFHRDFHTMRY